MKHTKTMLAAAILSLIELAGNSFAQTTTGTTDTSGTAVVIATNSDLRTAADALVKAQNWEGLQTLVDPYITGPFVYIDPSAMTEAQKMLNSAIDYKDQVVFRLSGAQAAHDWAISKGRWQLAANFSFYQFKNPTQAFTELDKHLALMPGDAYAQAKRLLFRSVNGENVNADIVSLVKAQTSFINGGVVDQLYKAYKASLATPADNVAFYTLLLQSMESNQGNAAMIGKLIDQKNKLSK